MFEYRLDPAVTSADGVVDIQDISSFHDLDLKDGAGEGVTVAVMDSGVDDSHPVFDDMDEIPQHSFVDSRTSRDDVGHGTACAGLIHQLAPKAEIISLRIFGGEGRTGMEPIRQAYDWLIDNAEKVDIVNMSWGSSKTYDPINNMHRQLLAEGIHDVVAAGNTGEKGGSPSTTKGAFSAGACTIDGKMTRFSSYNPDRDNPDVTALGKNVKLPRASGTSMGRVIDDNWVKASGTSFSAPITAGLGARYLSQEGESFDKIFEHTARDISGTPEDGAGIVDWRNVLEREKKKDEPDKPDQPDDGDGDSGNGDGSDGSGDGSGDSSKANVSVFSAPNGRLVYIDANWLSPEVDEASLKGTGKKETVISFTQNKD